MTRILLATNSAPNTPNNNDAKLMAAILARARVGTRLSGSGGGNQSGRSSLSSVPPSLNQIA
jgi:hypothetical protein